MPSGSQTGTAANRVSRRQLVQVLLAGGVAGSAGCMGVAEDQEPNDGGERDGSLDAATDRLTVAADTTPAAANVNQWADEEEIAGFEYFMELGAPRSPETWELLRSGTTFDADWIEGTDQVSIPTMLADYEVDPPHDVYETYDDRLTYWDGTPLDAEARLLRESVYHYQSDDGNAKFDDTNTFTHATEDQWTYHRWTDRGDVEGVDADERSRPVLENEVFGPEFVPMHPDFTGAYVERYEDASTVEAVGAITEELASEQVDFERFAEEGWGSGLYEIENADDVLEDRVVAKRREDHPNDHADVDELELVFASPDQEALAAERGEMDLGRGVVGERGRLSPDALPEHVGQIDRSIGDSGDKVLFNLNDHHLGRLWVRRAIVALVDWTQVTQIGWGEAGADLTKFDTGLHNTVSTDTFDWDFLSSLYEYPREYDLETAVDWLRRAGYEGSREEGWTSPEGEPLELEIVATEDAEEVYIRASQVIQANLQSLGVDATVEIVSNVPGYERRLGSDGDGVDFQIALFWDTFTEPWEFYAAEGMWWDAPLVAGESADDPWGVPAEDYPAFDTYGTPMAPEVPTDVGSIRAPDEAGRTPDLDDGETIELPPRVDAFRQPQTDGEDEELGPSGEERFQQFYRDCARVYNYYVPQFRFHDYARGAWGNLRDYDWPEEGSELNRMSRPDKFLARAGIPQHADGGD